MARCEGEARLATRVVGSAGGGALALVDAGSFDGEAIGDVADFSATSPVEAAGGGVLGAGDDPPQPSPKEREDAAPAESTARKRRRVMMEKPDTARDRPRQARAVASPS